MKTLWKTHSRLLSRSALFLLLGPFASAQSPPAVAFHSGATPAGRDGPVRVVSGTDVAAVGQSVSVFSARPVRDAAGQELGTVKDLLVDAYSDRVTYAAVAARTGGELRLVPFAALKQQIGTDGLMVEIAREQWEQMSPINAHEFEAGRITLSGAERRQLADRFGQSEPGLAESASPSAASATAPATSGGSHLIPVGELRGKRVSTGTENVGTIHDVVVDAGQATAAAILTPDPDFLPATHRFVVPLRHLNLAARDQSPIATALTRADFEQARLRHGGVSASETTPAPAPVVEGEPGLAPTGRSSSTARASSGAASLSDMISAVQHAIASEPPPSSASVQVVQQDGRLQLRGSVPNQALKEKVERAVREIAPGEQIENQIRVEPPR